MSKNKTSNCESYYVVGMSYHIPEFIPAAKSNPDYSLSDQKILDKGLENKRIMQYIFPFKHINLVEEPDNPHDPNAVKVLADGLMIGYIKKDECAHVKNMIRTGTIERVELEVFLYGNYKGVFGNEEAGYYPDSGSYDKGFCKINVFIKNSTSVDDHISNQSDVQNNSWIAMLTFMILIAVSIYNIRFSFIVGIFWLVLCRKKMQDQKSLRAIFTILTTLISIVSLICFVLV